MKKITPSPSGNPESDKPLKEMELKVNEFGQIVRDVDLDNINTFLDENVPDKKLEANDTVENTTDS